MQALQDIFISYGRKDSLGFASQLNQRLVDRGLVVWFDFDDIPVGVDYQKQIDDGIEQSDNFVFIISPHSVNSPYCLKEIELALKRNKRIIPLMHVERVSEETWRSRNPGGTDAQWQDYQAQGLHDHFQNMHPEIRKINWVYFREGVDDFESALTKLLGIVEQHQDYVRQHTTLLSQALEWERQQRRSQFLLVGEERLRAEAWLKTRFKDSQPPCLPTDLHCELITESLKNAENLMTQVFLSYDDEERAIAQKIRASLMREGFTVWISSNDIRTGVDFQAAIQHGIEEADNIVYLMSAASLKSAYCQQELEYGQSLHKRIIPILAEAIALEKSPEALRTLQYIDLTDNLLDTDYQQDESQLIRVLRDNAAYHEEHKILLVKALKWQRQQQNPTFLLRGYNLRHTEAWLQIAHQDRQHPPTPLQEDFIAASLRQPPGVSLDVFISYSRVDSGMARQLNDRLQIQGKRTWFDQESIAAGTADFQSEIHRGIESADHFLFILSPTSIASPYCGDEVEYAVGLNKRIVTILHRPIDVGQLHPELAKVQWLDWSQTESDDSANFQNLLRILDTDAEHLQSHTRLLLRAIEWEEKGRKESLLLRDDELALAEAWCTQSHDKEPQPTELQRSYIANSRLVEDASHQATEILHAAAAKGKRLIWLGAAAGAIGVVVAGVSGFAALKTRTEIQMADVRLITAKSNQQVFSGQTFASVLTALQAGQKLQKFPVQSAEWKALYPDVFVALNQSTREVRETNSLEGHQDTVWDVVFSPDGQAIASASYDKTIKLWDAVTGQEKQTLKGHQDAVFSLSFSPDGKTLASGSRDETLKLWDYATGTVKRTLDGQQGRIYSVSFSPDGKTLASGGKDTTIKLWDVATGTVKQTLRGHRDWVNSVRFSPDGKTLVSGSVDTTVKLWDVGSGILKQTLNGHKSAVMRVRFSPDGRTIASASQDHTIHLWDVATRKIKHVLRGHQDTVTSLSFSPDGKTLASSSFDKTIKLWNVAAGQEKQTLRGHQGDVMSLSFSPDGQTLASTSRDNTVKLWGLGSEETQHGISRQSQEVNGVSFSPDGQTVASAGSDQTIRLWAPATHREKQTLKGHQKAVISVAFSPDGRAISSTSADQTIRLWDATTGEEKQVLKGHQGWVVSVSWSPDGRTIASASDDKTVKLWDVATGQEKQTLTGHLDGTRSVNFSPDGKLLASASNDKTVKLWDVATGEVKQTLGGHQDRVLTVRFSPDGKTLASGSDDKTIRLWDVATGQEKRIIAGHDHSVQSIRFSPDGQTLASSSRDKTIRIWDIATGQEKQTLTGHQDSVEGLSFSPDGRTLVSGSNDKTVRFWILDIDRLMGRACDHIRDYLKTRPQQQALCDGYLPAPKAPTP